MVMVWCSDSTRGDGRSSLWSRIRLNLRNVPEAQRPVQEPLEVDFDPWAGLRRPEADQDGQRGPDTDGGHSSSTA